MPKRRYEAISSHPAAGLGAVAVAAALWAIAATTASDLFSSGVAPFELAEARAVIALAGLALLPASWRRPARPVSKKLIVALGLSIALVNLTYYVAIDHVDVAVALVIQYTAPALVVAWTAFSTRKRPARDVIVALSAAVTGVVLVSELPTGNFGAVDGVGLTMAVGAALFFATYTLLSEPVAAAYGTFGALFRGFMIASVFWILYQIPQGWPQDLFEPEHLPEVLFVGVGGTLVPFLLYVWGIGRVRAERATIAATLEPPLGGLFAWILLGQTLSWMQITGGLLVVVAVATMTALKASPAIAPEP